MTAVVSSAGGRAPSPVVSFKPISNMAKAKKGGVFAYVRGKVGSVTYSVLSAKNSSSGKKEQVVRSLPDSVSNPKTAGQALQRMKLAPAQKFYAAFSALLSNAFQGVDYGEASRRHFISLCMKADGPYIPKGADRFIPAAYPFSSGAIPSVGIMPFDGGADKITLAATLPNEAVSLEAFARVLNVTTDYQITVVVVNNVNGVFEPSYIGYADRLRIADMNVQALGKDDDDHITIDPLYLQLPMSSMVACCVVLSKQDASGTWLRSEQTMVISNQLREQLYSPDAMEAAIYSYQDGTTVNGINNEWYYNLGMSQAWGGLLRVMRLPVNQNDDPGYADVIVGIRQIQGRIERTVFATSTEPTGLIICVENGEVKKYAGATVNEFIGLNAGFTIGLWKDTYASQIDVVVPPVNYRKAYWRTVLGTDYAILVDEQGRVISTADSGWGEGESLPSITLVKTTGVIYGADDVTSARWYSEREQVEEWGVNAGPMNTNRLPAIVTLPAEGDKEQQVYAISDENTIAPAVTDFDD